MTIKTLGDLRKLCKGLPNRTRIVVQKVSGTEVIDRAFLSSVRIATSKPHGAYLTEQGAQEARADDERVTKLKDPVFVVEIED